MSEPKTWPIEKWKPARRADLDEARDWIRFHQTNIDSWNMHNRGQFSRTYSEDRLAFWTAVLMTERVP
jgi:hypothetical protein